MPFNQQLRDEVIQLHAQICAGLADPTRILILYSLCEQRRPVGELAKMLELNQPTVSRHLQILRDRGLVSAKREGTNMYYSLVDERVIQALDLMRAVLADSLVRQGNLLENVEKLP